jgi:hypothetical protein
MPVGRARVPQQTEEIRMFLCRSFGREPNTDWRGTAGLYAIILVAFLCTAFVAAVSDSMMATGGQQTAEARLGE